MTRISLGNFKNRNITRISGWGEFKNRSITWISDRNFKNRSITRMNGKSFRTVTIYQLKLCTHNINTILNYINTLFLSANVCSNCSLTVDVEPTLIVIINILCRIAFFRVDFTRIREQWRRGPSIQSMASDLTERCVAVLSLDNKTV